MTINANEIQWGPESLDSLYNALRGRALIRKRDAGKALNEAKAARIAAEGAEYDAELRYKAEAALAASFSV